jgi:hypothetical protein
MALIGSGAGRRWLGWTQLLAAGLLALGAWLLAIVLFQRPALKALFDLSPQARFTLEPATEELLADIRARGVQVEFHTLFAPLEGVDAGSGPERARVLHIHRTLQDLTRDLLRQYDYLGGDSVTVEHHDLLREPGTIKEVLKEVTDRRYNSVIVKVGKRSKTLSVDLELADIDDPSSVPGAPPSAQRAPPTLKDYKGEEAISTALKSLLVEGEPTVYCLLGRASITEPIGDSYSELATALTDEGFKVGVLDPAQADRVPVGDNVVLLVLEPIRELPDATAEMIVQFLRRGGQVLVLLPWQVIEDWNPTLDNLGRRLGFSVGSELVCHVVRDPSNPQQSIAGGAGVQNLLLTGLNAVHPVTRPLLARRRFPLVKLGREIRAVEGGAEYARLDPSFLRTGPGAWLDRRLPGGEPSLRGPQDQAAYAARSIGAIIDVDPLEQGGRSGHLVIVAATAFNNLAFQTNGDLALNIFNWLTERRALVGVRGKKYVARKIELTPQQLGRMSTLMIAGVPIALLLAGIVVFWRRSRS